MYVAEEHSIYGSSRVGVDNRKDTLYKAGSYSPVWGGASTSRRNLGSKSFELANHLGNVLVTVSDKPIYEVSSATIFFNPEITSSSDYYPFGAPMAGRGYSSEAYRFGFGGHEKMDEVSGSGNTIDMGDRWLSVRLGRTFKIDAKSAMYPDLSPYSYAANNPIFFIDPDGKEIKPSKAFLNSSYGALYQSLYKNNSAYGKIVAKYNTSKVFNLSLNYGDKGVPSGFNAWTTTKWNYLKSNPKNITSAESNQAYAETPLIKTVTSGDYIYTYERTDIGKVRTIIHEGLHSYLGAKGIEEGDEHTTFNTYRSMMVDALKEYNTDNKLGFTDDQLNELAYLGTKGSSQFKSYIQGIADKNVTKYDDELNAFNKRISDLEYKLVKTEKVEKKTESDSTETK
jgi:RHS repeat-associated protein